MGLKFVTKMGLKFIEIVKIKVIRRGAGIFPISTPFSSRQPMKGSSSKFNFKSRPVKGQQNFVSRRLNEAITS
jgi:hypothetical protein